LITNVFVAIVLAKVSG